MFTPAAVATVIPTRIFCPLFSCKSLYGKTNLEDAKVVDAVIGASKNSSNNFGFAPLVSVIKIRTKQDVFVPATFAPICVIFVPSVPAVSNSARLVVVAPVLSVVAAVTVTILVSGTSANMGDVFAGISVVVE